MDDERPEDDAAHQARYLREEGHDGSNLQICTTIASTFAQSTVSIKGAGPLRMDTPTRPQRHHTPQVALLPASPP